MRQADHPAIVLTGVGGGGCKNRLGTAHAGAELVLFAGAVVQVVLPEGRAVDGLFAVAFAAHGHHVAVAGIKSDHPVVDATEVAGPVVELLLGDGSLRQIDRPAPQAPDLCVVVVALAEGLGLTRHVHDDGVAALV